MIKFKKAKWKQYLSNLGLAIVILILLVPAWRIQFQGFFQRLFLTDNTIVLQAPKQVSFQTNEWLIFDQNRDTISFHTLADKPIVLNFWATWCPPCRAELPGLYEFYEHIKDEAYVIAVTNENWTKLEQSGLMNDYGAIFYKTNHWPRQFQFSAYPTTFILAPNFKIVSKIEGAQGFNTTENINLIKRLQ